MKTMALVRQQEQPADERVVLIADDDAGARALMALQVIEELPTAAVFEARDGAEALQIGLQQRPRVALLDVNLPRLGGVEVALSLRELQPETRIALWSADPPAARDRARDSGLPLFGKLQLEHALAWISAQLPGPTLVRRVEVGAPAP